jgi:hypothetical protein
MHLCGDWMCDEHGNLVSRAPQEIRGLSEDVSVEFAIAGIAGKGAQAGRFLFDPHWWSSGRFLRIGFGRKGGIRVFRLAGNWPRHWHWDIWKGGRL